MLINKFLLLPVGKQIAKILWNNFLSTHVLNVMIAQIEDKFKVSSSLMTGEKKLEAVIDILKKLQEVSRSGVTDLDLKAAVQFFYRILKYIRKEK